MVSYPQRTTWDLPLKQWIKRAFSKSQQLIASPHLWHLSVVSESVKKKPQAKEWCNCVIQQRWHQRKRTKSCVSSSPVICVDKVMVCFSTETGLNRRPAYSCGITLEVLCTYSSCFTLSLTTSCTATTLKWTSFELKRSPYQALQWQASLLYGLLYFISYFCLSVFVVWSVIKTSDALNHVVSSLQFYFLLVQQYITIVFMRMILFF